MINKSLLTNWKDLPSVPQWMSFVRYIVGGSQHWRLPLSWCQIAPERKRMTQINMFSFRDLFRKQTSPTQPALLFISYYISISISPMHFWLCYGSTCADMSMHVWMFSCIFSSCIHAGTFPSCFLWVFHYCLRLWGTPALSDGFICVDLSSLWHRLWAVVCVSSFQGPVCSLMSVWLTSSLAQISIKVLADEATADGCSVLSCLVCLRGFVKYMLIREKGCLCFPAGWTLPCVAFGI